MSCGNETKAGPSDVEALMPRKRPLRRVDRSICQRCRNAKSQFIMRSNTQCRDCYLLSINTNLLRVLYPPLRPSAASKSTKQAIQTRPPTQSGSVLIALSGGCGSMAMLDMLLTGGYIGTGDGKRADKTKGEKDVVWDKGYLVHVDFSAITGLPDQTNELRRRLVDGNTGMEIVFLKAEDAFETDLLVRLGEKSTVPKRVVIDLAHTNLPVSRSSASSSRSPKEQLEAFVNALPASSRPSALSSILSHLVNIVAATLPDISHVLLGETSTRDAQRVISGTAMGRGWALPLELAPSRERGAESRWTQMKPMKEITVKDASIYCHLKGLTTVNQRNWGGGVGSSKTKPTTIEGLTEQFIAGLNVTHPSTVSTINKTGDKLMFTGNKDGKRCPFCDECAEPLTKRGGAESRPVDPSALEWKSHTALTSLPDKTLEGEQPPLSRKDGTSLAEQLCYACLTTLTPTTVRTQEGQRVEMPIWLGEYLLS